ncbi:MAG: iron-containing alcohol dehydrogenase [Candidatus Binatia bacterium]|nr:iron-containing alcohol dehydrogenase [Candidatus Binatia bacterium]
MFALKKALHAIVIAITKVGAKLLPDRVPMTFIGTDSTSELCTSLAQTAKTKVLIVTDAGLVKAGIAKRVTDALDSAGVGWSVFDGVEPDPTFTQVDAGLSQLARDKCDAVLAVGGGSSMDAAKIIAASATNGNDAHKLEGMMKVRRPPLSLSAIPTTAGTGSEVTVAAVVSDSQTHEKKFFVDPKLLPEMTALDPSLMAGLPPAITAATGMDALTHAIESFISKTSNAQTERWATAAVRLIFTNLPTAYANGSDLDARKAMAISSYYAGLAFTRTSVGYVHAIAHTFGAYYRTPHGMANAIALPHVLEFSKNEAREQLAALGDLIGVPGGSEAEKAEGFIRAVRELMARIGIPYTLEALRTDDIPAIAKQALAEAHMNYPVPRYMGQPDCERLLRDIVA